MKYTLLELTQAILSSMDSDTVTSINDTPEALQVANVIKATYYDLINRADVPEHYTLTTLTDSGTAAKPVLMTLPTALVEIKWLKYDKHTSTDLDILMQPVDYLPLDEFLKFTYALDLASTAVDSFTHVVGSDTLTFLHRNDTAPTYYTTFDDSTFIFDAYDSAVETYLKGSKTLVYGKKLVTWSMTDGYTPTLDEPQFALLLNEAKALAFAELRQTQHAKAEVNARRGWTTLQHSKHASEIPSFFHNLPNYGRK